MSEYSNSAGIMYPASFIDAVDSPFLPEDLHTTIFYLGEIDTLSYTVNDVLDALSGIDFNFFVIGEVVEQAMFGENEDIPVLLVKNQKLFDIHEEVEHNLSLSYIKSGSRFTDYKPHITVDALTWANPPTQALLHPAQLWWGDERFALS